MAKKRATTKAHPEPKSSKPAATEHPALTLFHALNALHTVCSNARLFRELAQRRERARAMHLNMLNAKGQAAAQRASTLASAGRPFSEQWRELTEETNTNPPPSNEPAKYTKALRDILDNGRTWNERARVAMRAGGAKGLDAATHSNAAGQTRSIELHTKLQDAERVFVGLTIGVGDPRIVIDKDAANMADLGEWFGRTRDELGAVLETRGLDAPSAAQFDQDAGLQMQRPVPVAKAAHVAGVRSDVLLKKLRVRHYPIGGVKGAYQAELAHIQVALPERKRQLRDWAEKKYPIE